MLISRIHEALYLQCIVHYLAIAQPDTQHISFLKICHLLDLVRVVLSGQQLFHDEIAICQTVRILQIYSLWNATEECVLAGNIARTCQDLDHGLATAIHS